MENDDRVADVAGLAVVGFAIAKDRGDDLILRLLELGARHRLVVQRADDLEERFLPLVGGVAAGHGDRGDEQPCVFPVISVGLGVLRDLLPVDEGFVEPRRVALREDCRSDDERGRIGAGRRRDEPGHAHRRQRHVRPLLGELLQLFAGRLLHGDARDRQVRMRNRAEVFVDPHVELRLVEVADNHEDGVVGAVERSMKGLHVGKRGGVEVLDAADAGALVWMHRVRIRFDGVPEAAVRRGQDAVAELFLDDVALRLEVRVADVEGGHAIAFGPEQGLEVIRRDDLVILRGVVTRGGIVVPADVFSEAVHHLRRHVLRALEHQMLEEMSEAAAAGRVVLRADAVPDLDGHGRTGLVLDRVDVQSVRQRAMFVLDRRHVELLRCVRLGFRLRRCERRARDRKRNDTKNEAVSHGLCSWLLALGCRVSGVRCQVSGSGVGCRVSGVGCRERR